jgi:hypothetical protein
MRLESDDHGSDPGVRQMARLQVEDAGKALTVLNGKLAEVTVVGHDHSLLAVGFAKHFGIVSALKTAIEGRTDVLAPGGEVPDDQRMDVLVGEKRELEELHAEIFTSQTISFFTASAACRKAAARPSAETWG